MNVLILTPDRVGSTLLQRVLTVYMLRKGFDKPVINLHELVTGLESQYNDALGQQVLGKPQGVNWGYYQSLPEITNLLSSATHYTTSRLAHYHIINRKDSIADQIPFYEFLNNNFYIISARRSNLFEYALSWCINAHSKKLNVYNVAEKINTFHELYKNKITVNRESFINYLEKYKQYIEWSDNYFRVQSVFNYEDSVNNVEDYILNLEFMKNSEHNSWSDIFGQTFNEWNACHRLLPNLLLNNTASGQHEFTVSIPTQELQWNQLKGSDWPEFENFDSPNVQLLPRIKEEIHNHFEVLPFKQTVMISDEVNTFFKQHLGTYKETFLQLENLARQGFLASNVPIKLQTLNEKKSIINNFTDSIQWYNEWASVNGYELFTEDKLLTLSNHEEASLNRFITESTNLLAVK